VSQPQSVAPQFVRALRAKEAGVYLAQVIGLTTPVPAQQMWRLARTGDLPAVRLGRTVWFQQHVLDAVGRASKVTAGPLKSTEESGALPVVSVSDTASLSGSQLTRADSHLLAKGASSASRELASTGCDKCVLRGCGNRARRALPIRAPGHDA
jgi:hypothetical protein